MSHFDSLSQPPQLESPTSSATPISPLHGMTTQDVGRAGVGRGGGGGGSLPESPLLEPGHLHPTSHSGQQVCVQCACVCGGRVWVYYNINDVIRLFVCVQIVSSPPSASSTLSPSLAMSTLPPPPPSHSPSLLPPSNLPPSLGTTPLPAFPVLSQPLPPPPLPSLSLSSSLPSHTHTPSHGMTQFMQGLHSALAPHQSSSIPFSNHHLATATAPFGAPLTSMASSLTNPPPSLPLLSTLYPYGPYGGMGGVPVVQSCPVSVGVVGGGPTVNCGGSPGVLSTAPFPSHSLMPTYSTYIPPSMYPSNQMNASDSST